MNDTTSDVQDLKLAMYDYDVPCIFGMVDECTNRAKWLVLVGHEDRKDCQTGEPDKAMPMCQHHVTATKSAFNGFWQTWLNQDPPACAVCHQPVELVSVERISKS